jgi:molybdate transport system ATP-binding protein
VVVPATVVERDARWQLARLQLGEAAAEQGRAPADAARGAGDLAVWTRDHGLPVGSRARVRLLARDVSLARERHPGSSIGNQLDGVVEAMVDDEHPALTLVRVRLMGAGDAGVGGGMPGAMADGAGAVGGLPLLARLTRRSADALALAPGVRVVVLVKTVALME